MSVSLGLWHTTQKKVTDSVHSSGVKKKKKKKEISTDSSFAARYKHQTASRTSGATTDYGLPVASTLSQERVSTLQHKAHTGWRAWSTGLSPANPFLVFNHKHHSSPLGPLVRSGKLHLNNTNVASHGSAGLSRHSSTETSALGKGFAQWGRHSNTRWSVLREGKALFWGTQKKTLVLTAPDIQAATSKTLLSSTSTALIHKAVLLDQIH